MNDAQMRAYTYQSQLIEGIVVDQTSKSFTQHLDAAWFVYSQVQKKQWPDIKTVHQLLMDGELLTAGIYRTSALDMITVDSRERYPLPAPENLPHLMEEWEDLCDQYRHIIPTSTTNNNSYTSKVLYFQLLCIHPFTDGNGRVGRLMYNAMRGLAGLPWLTLTPETHSLYVNDLRQYETGFFKKKFADAY